MVRWLLVSSDPRNHVRLRLRAQPTATLYTGLTWGTQTEDPPTNDRLVPQESPADPAREGDRRYHMILTNTEMLAPTGSAPRVNLGSVV